MLLPARNLACALILALAPAARGDLEGHLAAGDLVSAEAELEQLADEWREAVEKDPSPANRIGHARVLQALGTIQRQLDRADEAAGHLAAALDLAKDSPAEAADIREALALARQDLGDLAAAENLLRETLAFREIDAEPAALAATRDHLGLLLLQLGRYPEAAAQLQAAFDATPAGDPVALARRHGHLGRYRHTLGSHARALRHFEEALALLDGRTGEAELRLALVSQQALAHLRLGDVEQARSGFESAADTARSLFRGRGISAAPHLNNLGTFAMATGDPDAARAAFAECLAMLQAGVGADHPALVAPLNNLGTACQELGNYDEARTYLERAAALQQRHLPPGHLRVAETARNLARNAILAGDPAAPALTERATALGLGLLDRLIRQGSETERLNFLQRIDLLSLPCSAGDAPAIANTLAASKNRLLDALLATPSDDRVPTLEEIRDVLPPAAAFVDFCRYTETTRDAVVRYGAVVHVSGKDPVWIRLGTEDQLRGLLDALRLRLEWKAAALAGSSSEAPPLQLRGLLREIHRGFMEPLEPALPPDCRQLFVAPDASLHFLPFAALIDAQGSLLCEKLDLLVALGSARDLVSNTPPPPLAGAPWRLAGVTDFPAAARDPDDPLAAVLSHPAPLPGTREELRRIREIAPPGTLVHENESAAESSFSGSSPAPRVLHLGTHSFAIPGPDGPAAPIDFDRSADLLFSSGILLHRAALRPADAPLLDPDDDLLFPAEIAALPLAGTRLVTLSSCHSGGGTALSGEGVLGLRRAFLVAGAREVLVALWPVSDEASPDFMHRFYQLALATDHPAQALWQTQREFLAAGDDFEAAVLHAAPFVLSQRGGPLPLAAMSPPDRPWPWKWLLGLLPLGLFLGSRLACRAAHAEKR
jgi:CHAT domain-containing protein/tetratricopeptide (TPR) repeat protein